MLTKKGITLEDVQRWLGEKLMADKAWVAELRASSKEAQADMRAKGYI